MSEISMNAWRKKVALRMDKLKRGASFKLFSAVIKSSPVGNPDLWKTVNPPAGYKGGRFRANWKCSLDRAVTTTTISTNFSNTIGAVRSVLNGSDRHKVDFLSNSLPYAYALEYQGHSTQAPYGIVGINVVRFKKLVSLEARRLRRS